MGAGSEALREQETSRYASSLLLGTVYQTGTTLVSPSSLRTSQDTVLTGFAQLLALRLNGARTTISLFDQNWQYVIAEATPTGPLEPSITPHDDPHRLLLCGTAVPRTFAICEHVLQHANTSPADTKHPPILVVRDAPQDLGLSENKYFKDWPHRGYAGIPLTTKKGTNIGVLGVYGGDIQGELDEASLMLLRDVSQMVMRYLEATRSAVSHRRSERMVRGIGSFVEGEAGLGGWQDGPATESFQNESRAEGSLNVQQQDIQNQRRAAAAAAASDLNVPASPTEGSMTSKVSELSFDLDTQGVQENVEVRSMKHIFSKAANVLRESIEVEGILFFDAAISSFGGDISRSDREFRMESSSSDDAKMSPSPDQREAPCRVLGSSDSLHSSIDSGSSNPGAISERFLSKLLKRYPNGKIFNYDEKGYLQSSESSDDTSAPDTESHLTSVTSRPKAIRQYSYNRAHDGNNIISLFPGARSVAFIPVWDAHKDRWLAGGFAYTKMLARTFTVHGELSYLLAFASITVAEIQRVRETFLSRTKSDLLGSLSHELRSPLHGIVLGAELLHDTEMDVFQQDVLNSMECCSRTLLDTIDHLLDWTKINKFKTSAQQRRNSLHGRKRGDLKNTNLSIESGMMSITSNVEIDLVTEQVVESIFAGHSFQTMSVMRSTNEHESENADIDAIHRLDSAQALESLGMSIEAGHIRVVLGEVVVSLDIKAGVPWTFVTQPGAIRRVLTNILGNALKFTSQGSVKVILDQEPKSAKLSHRRVVSITISDTGRGMSREYVQNHLFQAFSQENSLNAGTGLGLSLVHKIVSSLGGSIHVRSKLGEGSTIVVKLPLKQVISDAALTGEDAHEDFAAQVNELQGLRIAINGYEGVDLNNNAQKALLDERMLLAKVCKEWLKMHVIESSEFDKLLPDLIICGERHMHQLVARDDASTPAVVICRNALSARQYATSPRFKRKRGMGIVDFISQPLGPRKLAKGLLQCFKNWTQLQASMLSTRALSQSETSAPPQHASRPPPESIVEPVGELNGEIQSYESSESALQSASSSSPPESRQNSDNTVQPSSGSRSGKLHIAHHLLVEDNAINLKILTTYMKKLGHSYETASNGLEALEIFKRGGGRFKCVLMDISMPVMDGFESTRRIRSFERDQHLPRCTIYALTGLASDSAQKEAFGCGIDIFLTKPVRLAELSEIMGRVSTPDSYHS